MDNSKRFVAFFDIMGFKDMVRRNDHSIIMKKMELLHVEIISPMKDHARIMESRRSVEGSTSDNFSFVQPVIFSDTIMLVSGSNTVPDAETILFASAWLMIHCLQNEIPIKGAVSYGTFTADIDRSIYFGQPLIDAYLLEEELMMYGCVIDHSFQTFLKENNRLPNWILKWYKVPLKSGKVNHYTVNWLDEKFEKIYQKQPEEILEKLYDSVSGSPRVYLDNTVEFVNSFNLRQPH